MMTCCKRNDKSKLVNEDSSDEGNFVKQANIKQKSLLDPKPGVASEVVSAWSTVKRNPIKGIGTFVECTNGR